MDHSIIGYLNRRTNQELEMMLEHYLRDQENLPYIVLEILSILRNREIDAENIQNLQE